MQLFCFFDGMCHIRAFDVHLKLCPKRTSRSKHIPVTLKTRISYFIIIRGSFLLRFEEVFGCRIYFNSVYIIPVGIMLFNRFLADVNLDFLIYCSIVLAKLLSVSWLKFNAFKILTFWLKFVIFLGLNLTFAFIYIYIYIYYIYILILVNT